MAEETFVSLDVWRSKTSLPLRRRSADMVQIDEAYGKWIQRTNDVALARILHSLLTAYLRSKGGNWANVERDKASKQLMQRVYAFLDKAVGGPEDRGAKALRERDIPHSRFGVLFLLGNIEIDIGARNHAAYFLRGAGSIAGDFLGGLDDAKLADCNFMAVGQKIPGASVANLGGALGGRVIGSTGTVNPLYRAKAQPGLEMTRAAAGLGVGVNVALAGTPIVGGLIVDAANNLLTMVTNLLERLVRKLCLERTTSDRHSYNTLTKLVAGLIKAAAKKICEEAAPFVGGALDVAGGLARTIQASAERIASWWDRRRIVLNPGHPELLANEIERVMRNGIFTGLADTLKGIGKTAMDVWLPGAGSLVSAVMSMVGMIVSFVLRLDEQERIKRFLAEARGRYARERQLALAKMGATLPLKPTQHLDPETDPAKGGLITQVDKFSEFYQRGCDASPLIPMLTLNSGICGSQWVLMRMFKDTGERIGQAEFDTGTQYFSRLKRYGREYLSTSGFRFRSREPNGYVQGLLNHAVHSHDMVAGVGEKLLSAAAAL